MFKVDGLTYRYPRNTEDTLRGISFEFGEGEIFGFLGPSGAGKSTTQKILIRLLKGYGGTIVHRGRDLKTYGQEFFNDIGVGFEVPVHFSKLTAMENLGFYSRLYRRMADVEGLLKRVGLWEDRNKRVGDFSKGMKMRLNFVRAMLNDPQILFLDEPTNGLDPANARVIKDLIREFKQGGGTVFLTTHLMHDADELCDRVAFIADGEIREIDSPKNLKLRFGQRLVTVEYRDGEGREGAASEQGAANGASAADVSASGVRKESFDMNGLGSNERFFHILKTKEIVTIHSGETTLDDIFIRVTGVKLVE